MHLTSRAASCGSGARTRRPSNSASSTARTRPGSPRRSRSPATSTTSGARPPRASPPAPTTPSARKGPKGATHDFDGTRNLLDPYARGLAPHPDRRVARLRAGRRVRLGRGREAARSASTTPSSTRRTSRASRSSTSTCPEELRGTYAGLAHPSTIAYLKDLGVTTVELLPVHQFVSEQRLTKMGLVNYWGYNTLNFFTPHAAYATRARAVRRHRRGAARVQGDGAPAARGRPRGDPRRRLQPHLRGGPRRPDQLVPRARQRELLPAVHGRARRRLHRHHRMRQHPRLLEAASPSGSCSTRCGTGRTRCRSTGSASTWPPRSGAGPTARSIRSIRC